MQVGLFEATDVERVVWRQLPEGARNEVSELFAGLLLKNAQERSRVQSEERDER